MGMRVERRTQRPKAYRGAWPPRTSRKRIDCSEGQMLTPRDRRETNEEKSILVRERPWPVEEAVLHGRAQLVGLEAGGRSKAMIAAPDFFIFQHARTKWLPLGILSSHPPRSPSQFSPPFLLPPFFLS